MFNNEGVLPKLPSVAHFNKCVWNVFNYRYKPLFSHPSMPFLGGTVARNSQFEIWCRLKEAVQLLLYLRSIFIKNIGFSMWSNLKFTIKDIFSVLIIKHIVGLRAKRVVYLQHSLASQMNLTLIVASSIYFHWPMFRGFELCSGGRKSGTMRWCC